MIKTEESVKKAKVGSPATLTLCWPAKLLRPPNKLCPNWRGKRGSEGAEREQRKVECEKEEKRRRQGRAREKRVGSAAGNATECDSTREECKEREECEE